MIRKAAIALFSLATLTTAVLWRSSVNADSYYERELFTLPAFDVSFKTVPGLLIVAYSHRPLAASPSMLETLYEWARWVDPNRTCETCIEKGLRLNHSDDCEYLPGFRGGSLSPGFWQDNRRAGIDAIGWNTMVWISFRRNRFHIEYWLLLVITSTYPLFALIRGPVRRYRRKRKGLCIACGYNLTGLPEPRCPECGSTN